MNKKDFDGALRRQCFWYPGTAREQIEGFYKGLSEDSMMPDELLRDMRNIYMTGSGDSWAACMVALPAFQKYVGAATGSMCTFQYDTTLHMSRFTDIARVVDKENIAEMTLLIAISVFGKPVRIVECVERANQKGCYTLDITEYPDTPIGHASKYILDVHNPKKPDMLPGCLNYFGSIVGSMMLAAHMGELKGSAPAGSVRALGDAIIALAESYAPTMEAMDDAMFQIAQKWQGKIRWFEGVGDGNEYASAFFFPAKIIEAAGNFSTWSDSIEWCRTNRFAANPEKIGTVVFGEIDRPNYRNIGKVVQTAYEIGRPVLFVGDAPKEEFGITSPVDAWVVPKPPKEFGFLTPLFNHLPSDILASYLAELWGETHFRSGSDMVFTAKEIINVWGDPEMSSRLENTKIMILD